MAFHLICYSWALLPQILLIVFFVVEYKEVVIAEAHVSNTLKYINLGVYTSEKTLTMYSRPIYPSRFGNARQRMWRKDSYFSHLAHAKHTVALRQPVTFQSISVPQMQTISEESLPTSSQGLYYWRYCSYLFLNAIMLGCLSHK